MKKLIKEYGIITASTIVVAVGIYFFKFPNNFSFGGVTGLAVVVQKVTNMSASTFNLIINGVLLVLGFIFLGRKFGIKTVYASSLLSVLLSLMEWIWPLKAPITDQRFLELCFAIALPAFGSAILFNIGASSGGTDIIAMILKKYTSFDLGTALFISDVLITLTAFFVFDPATALYSVLGLMIKSLMIDGVIESINLCKYFNIICDDPKPICDFITNDLKRSATVVPAKGAFSNSNKYIVFAVLRRNQAVMLRLFIKKVEPTAFILISNSSEIIGKGFQTT